MKFDFTKYTNNFISSEEVSEYASKTGIIKERFETNSDEVYFYDLKNYINNEELKEIKRVASNIRMDCDVLLVVAIGGSYMGSCAINTALNNKYKKNDTEVIYIGNNLSSSEYLELIEYLKDKDICINVISKSGETLEVLTTFKLLMPLMKKKYRSSEIKKRVIVTTNQYKGRLYNIAKKNNYQLFIIPEKIGGRYSIFTPAGLIPLAVNGIDITDFLKGASLGRTHLNHATIYAMIRNIMFDKNRIVEAFTIYDEKLSYFSEWLKQLFAESEGKNNLGVLPISIINPRDLHSLGQFIDSGNKITYSTIIDVENYKTFKVKEYNKTMLEINNIVKESAAISQMSSNNPSINITLDSLNSFNLGEACMFFMMSAAISAYLFEVNPFDQPGVNNYKQLVLKALLDS